MGLEGNSLTIASHTVMVLILSTLIWRALKCVAFGHGEEAMRRGLLPAIAICATALIIERLYYVAARVLKVRGLDLWSMHPAPETLSLIVGIGFYGIMVPILRASGQPAARTKMRICAEVLSLFLIWAMTVVVLY
tara:strand:+ start:4013 stop:4417 length:405 start_codon:yes stop_codon:yes gene_type:complete